MSFNRTDSGALELLLSRRSGKASCMVEPGPTPQEIQEILAAATRVPDHGKLNPWRFIVVDKAGQNALSPVFEAAYVAETGGANSLLVEGAANFPTQAPLMIVAVFSPKPSDKIPLFEQQLSCGAACQNLMVAAHALGYLGGWLTGWASRNADIASAFDLADGESVAGFIFIGSYDRPLSERKRPSPGDVISYYKSDS